MTIYQPNGPYVIQSGKRAGKVLELLTFKEYSFLAWMLQKLNQTSKNGKNELHLHLEWLIKKGENRRAKMICPQCKKQTVKYFSILYGHNDFSIGFPYTCCGNPGCIEKLTCSAVGELPQFLPFSFSVLKKFRLKVDQKRIIDLFRVIFRLPEHLTRQIAFEFFNS